MSESDGKDFLGIPGAIKACIEIPSQIVLTVEKISDALYRIREKGAAQRRVAFLERVILLQAEQQQQQQQQQRQNDQEFLEIDAVFDGIPDPQIETQQRQAPHLTDDTEDYRRYLDSTLTFRADGSIEIFENVSTAEEKSIVKFNAFLDDMKSNCQSIVDAIESNPLAFTNTSIRKDMLAAMRTRLDMMAMLDRMDRSDFSNHRFRGQFFDWLHDLTIDLGHINEQLANHIAEERKMLDAMRGLKRTS